MINRWLLDEVVESLRYRRVVHITGARQTGKTTLASATPIKNARRYTLDNDNLKDAASDDPIEFTARKQGETLVIDEVQKVPELLNAIKIHVDESTERGQYLLTGSSSLDFMHKSADSLAGRMHTIRLRSLTLGEINGNPPTFLDGAFKREFKDGFKKEGKRAIIHRAFVGGYPETIDFPDHIRREWHEDYVRTLIARDVKNVAQIRKLDLLADILRWLLARSSKLWTLEELCAATQISKDTAKSYVSALKALYIVDQVPAWNKTDYDRIGKMPKYFATDTGLIASCLGWNEEETFLNGDLSGKLIESWVYHEISALADCSRNRYSISHYRDKDKHEIDFIVTDDQGDLLGIEVKAGGRVTKDDFKNLYWFANNLAKKPFVGIVLYSGDDVIRVSEGFFAVPLAQLGA